MAVWHISCYRALNGLRDASLAWLNLPSESIKAVDLVTDDMEPCIYQGCIQRRGSYVGSAILIVYVDDPLLCSDSDEVEKVVEDHWICCSTERNRKGVPR